MSAPHFGLDIGRSFIKVVSVNTSGNKKTLEAVGSVQTPGGGIQSESPIDLEKVADSIKKAVDTAKISTRRCIVSIIESQTITRLISMPNLTDKELSAAIHWEAEQYIPLPLKDVNLQYKVITRSNVAGEKMEVILIAAPKRIIDKYLTIVKKAGLEPQAIETESTALSRALTRMGDPATIIMSMGAISTELVIAIEGNVLFTRSIATGGLSLTKAIMAEFNLPPHQAEQYKQSYGILEDKLSGKVAAVLKPTLDILASELLKAVEFAHTHVQKSPIVRIMVCGGGAYLPGLPQFLAARLNLEISLGDPWADFVKDGLILKLPGQGGFYAVATGLAQRR